MSTEQAPSSTRWLLWLVAIGFFMETLDATIVNTALPSMAHSLGENPLRMQSVAIAYILTVAILLPASGWLADRFGVRRIFLCAIALFTTGSLACALAPNLSTLVFARILQGAGGAMMVPVGRLTVFKAVPRKDFMAAMNFVTLPGLIGPLVGPTLGGFLVEYVSWHWIFLINLPIGLLGMLATWKLMPNFALERVPRFDFGGFILIATSMAMLTLALEGAGELHLTMTTVVPMLAFGFCALMLYWQHANRAEAPLFNPRLLKVPSFAMGAAGSFFGRIGTGALPLLTPLFLQMGLGFSPMHAGMMSIPTVIGSMSMKRVVVGTVQHFGYRRVLSWTTVLLGLTVVGIGLCGLAGYYPLMIPLMVLQGGLNATRFSAMNTYMLKDLDNSLAGSGNSMMSMIMQLTMSLGAALVGLLLVAFGGHFATEAHELHTMFLATYLCVGAALIAPALLFVRIDDRPAPVVDDLPDTGNARVQSASNTH
ncbi:multidrug transporter subunit MdtD [Jeongeupia naejangsanensis]|uniref:Multidrug transporter subunit MdtD n=1 Tax=Jeongeupia naejangsanensis TaxID=613195 RepID=A0ABS2BIG0_9NEIS|nr:multidrug transporter subunit MdtD [Jeongeupia naejangsanensis]MBM3115392.1 multidrug transporter subunit MdtD [Jeongeupia naejangsanensis]